MIFTMVRLVKVQTDYSGDANGGKAFKCFYLKAATGQRGEIAAVSLNFR